MSHKYTIQEVVTGCIRKQAKFQKILVDDHSESLYSVCLRYMGREHLAQDVLQESFIRILKFINTYDADRGALGAWMRRVTINVALKHLKKSKLKIIDLDVIHNDKIHDQPSIIDRMSYDEILAVVRTIPDGYRQVFNLAVIEGYSHREIGELLDIKEVTSRSKLSRAKQLLRNKLETVNIHQSWTRTV